MVKARKYAIISNLCMVCVFYRKKIVFKKVIEYIKNKPEN